MHKIYAEFCRLRDLRDYGKEAPKYTEAEAFEKASEPADGAAVAESFQQRVQPWMLACFGEMIAGDREERNHRFLEEALELVQACGCTTHEALQLVDYVYGRPVGDPPQEVGGVMVTLAALCLANQMDMQQCGETELARIWTKVEAIRAKQAAKPKYSPLPAVPAIIQANPQATTYPREIWLQAGECSPDEARPYTDGLELTWCWESIDRMDVRYVRADLAGNLEPVGVSISSS